MIKNPKMNAFLAMMMMVIAPVLGQQTYENQTSNPEFNNALELYHLEKYGAARFAFEQFRRDNEHASTTLLVDAAYLEARCAMELDNEDAAYLFEKFLVDFPESNKTSYVQFHLGEMLQESGKFRQANRMYEKVNGSALDATTQHTYWFKYGYCLFMDDNYDQAIGYFLKLKDIETPHYLPANYYYAHIQYSKKNYDVALKGFKKLEDDPTFEKIVPFYIAQIHYLKGDYDKAIEYATPLLDQGTEQRQADMARIIGNSWFAKKEYGKATPYYEKCIANSSFALREDYYHLGFCYYFQKNYSKAAENLSKVTSSEDSLSQNAYYHLGDCHLKLNDRKRARVAFEAASKYDFDKKIQEDAMINYLKLNYELAYSPFNEIINSFLKFIEMFPQSDHVDEAYEYLGKAFLTTKNYKQALESMEKIKKKDSNVYRAMQRIACYRGLELFTSTQFSEAIGFFNQSLKYGEYDKDLKLKAYYWRGESFYRLGNYQAARSDYNEYIALPGSYKLNDFKTAHYNIGYTYFKEKNYPEAGRWFDKYIQLAGNDQSATTGDACNRAGDCHFVNREFPQAIAYYEKSIAITAGTPDYAMYQKAFCLGLQKKHDEKIALLKQMARNYPASPYVDDAIYESGRSYVALNDHTNAIYQYKTVKEKYPQSTLAKKALLQLGLVYYNDGEMNNSMTYYKRVINEYPGTPEAEEALSGLKNVYMDKSDPEGFIKYSETLGTFGKIDIREQDSLTFESAQRFYMKDDCDHAIAHFENYLTTFPDGRFALDAHYYKADCQYRKTNYKDAVKSLEYVISKGRNRYTEEALIRSGEIYYMDNDYPKALDKFRTLEQIAEMPENQIEARIGAMRCLIKMKDNDGIIQSANSLLKTSKVAPEIEREARFARAKAYLDKGDFETALSEFKPLASNPKSAEGAESKYWVAQINFNNGNDAAAEKEIFDLADKGTSHQYWLARSFILLSDIYIKRGEDFQAQQYLESIMENYDENDDIKPMVSSRLKTIRQKSAAPEKKEQQIQL